MIKNGILTLDGVVYDNPLDDLYPKRKYKEWKETQKTSYKSIWLDHYLYQSVDSVGYESVELIISNRNKVFLGGKELKDENDISSVVEIFSNLKFC